MKLSNEGVCATFNNLLLAKNPLICLGNKELSRFGNLKRKSIVLRSLLRVLGLQHEVVESEGGSRVVVISQKEIKDFGLYEKDKAEARFEPTRLITYPHKPVFWNITSPNTMEL